MESDGLESLCVKDLTLTNESMFYHEYLRIYCSVLSAISFLLYCRFREDSWLGFKPPFDAES
jgi:hypothetical protein